VHLLEKSYVVRSGGAWQGDRLPTTKGKSHRLKYVEMAREA